MSIWTALNLLYFFSQRLFEMGAADNLRQGRSINFAGGGDKAKGKMQFVECDAW